MAEELQPIGGATEYGGVTRPRLHVDDLRPKGEVNLVLEPSAGMDRAGDKFPERVEVLERGLARIKIVRRRVMHVGREPDGVADVPALDEGENVGELKLAAARLPVVALSDRLETPFTIVIVNPQQSEGHVVGDHLPGGMRIDQLALEPGDLLGAEEIGGWAVAGLEVLRVGTAVAAHVEHEHIEQWTVRYFAIDAAWLGRLLDHWQIFAHGAVGACAEEERGLLVIVPAPMLGAGEQLARPPIVEDLVVVPLRERWDLGIEREQVLVEQIVFPVAAVVLEGLGYVGLFLGDEVPPDFPVGELDLGR